MSLFLDEKKMIVQSKHSRAGMSALTSAALLIDGDQLKPCSPDGAGREKLLAAPCLCRSLATSWLGWKVGFYQTSLPEAVSSQPRAALQPQSGPEVPSAGCAQGIGIQRV